MARTVNSIWDKVIDFGNLYFAYRAAGHGKRYRREALCFSKDLEENLIILQNELIWEMYKPIPFRQFCVFEPKRRLISAPAFRDRVVHHALVQIIEPYFERRFISESFACRKGLGTHAAMKHVVQCCRAAKRRWGSYYVLKCDIHKFFPSINHDVLKRAIRRTISDPKVIHLLNIIIDSFEPAGRGIPIGALTSQLLANVYLDQLDHFIKDECGVKYYARYVDDFLIIHNEKKYLKEMLIKIDIFVSEKLDVSLNPKTGIFPGRHGIDFCGYRIWPAYVKPRKATIKRAKRRFKKMAKTYQKSPKILERAHQSIQSFLGYIHYCSGYKTTESVLKRAVFKASGEKQ